MQANWEAISCVTCSVVCGARKISWAADRSLSVALRHLATESWGVSWGMICPFVIGNNNARRGQGRGSGGWDHPGKPRGSIHTYV